MGVDNVDLQEATEFGCLVVNAPIENTCVAAEHEIALSASMAQDVPQVDGSPGHDIHILEVARFAQ